MQARVLKLYAAHEEAQVRANPHPHPQPKPQPNPNPYPYPSPPNQARLEHAKTLRSEAHRLETTYGFCS
jgi:hypothetical protein